MQILHLNPLSPGLLGLTFPYAWAPDMLESSNLLVHYHSKILYASHITHLTSFEENKH